MCGIIGVVGAVCDGLDSLALRDALDLLSHRGPDAEGTWIGDGVMFGHRRLSIIDLDNRADQPMRRGPISVVFNGEIYNFRQLRAELSALGYCFETSSDTEVVTAAWRQWGRDCLSRFEGMFALAVWDASEHKLTLARDRYGEKPLFWLGRGSGIMFASEIPPLVRLCNGVLEEDPEAVGLYFLLSYVPAPAGIFQGLNQIEPGCWLEWDDGSVRHGRYYELRREPAAGEALDTYDEACRQLKYILSNAVRERVETADVPVATLLSGGIDSSIISILASKHMASPMKAYSLGFPEDPGFDETEYARSVAAHSGTLDHRIVPASERALLDYSPAVFDRLGEPFADASLLPTAYLCSNVEEKVVLGGDAADELFAGYGVYPAIIKGARLPNPLRRLLLAFPSVRNPHSITNSGLRAAALFHRNLGSEPLESYVRWRTYADPIMLSEFGIDTSGLNKVTRGLAAALSHKLADIQAVDLKFNLPNDMLKKVDYASMMNGIEVRLPFLETALVHWALRLPEGYLLKGNVRKRILRDAFAAELPAKILHRGKKGFLLPIRSWFRAGALKEELGAMLGRQTRFDVGRVGNVLKQHSEGRADHSVYLWALYVYLRWQGNLARWATHTCAEVGPVTR